MSASAVIAVAESAITKEALETAARRLARSETGMEAARLLHRFLRGAGGSLDGSNQTAVMVLLAAAFGSFPGTVLGLLAVAATGARIVITAEDSEL